METIFLTEHNRKFIYTVVERVLFIFLTLSLFASSITIVHAAAIQSSQDFTFSLDAGEFRTVDTTHMDFSVSSVKMTSDIKTSGILEVSVVKGRPIDKFLISRIAYEYFRMASSESLATGSVYFTVDKTWIDGNNLPDDAVSLYWFDLSDNRWRSVDTTLRYIKGDEYHFVADIDHYGYFVIADTDVAVKSVSTETKTVESVEDNSQDAPADLEEVEMIMQTPDVEVPSPNTQGSSSLLLTLGLGLIVVGSLGTGTYVLVKGMKKDADSQKRVQKSSHEKISAAIAAAENKAYSQAHIQNPSLKDQIEDLEPKVAKQFVLKMRAQGMDDDSIMAELLQHNISYSVIQKVLG